MTAQAESLVPQHSALRRSAESDDKLLLVPLFLGVAARQLKGQCKLCNLRMTLKRHLFVSGMLVIACWEERGDSKILRKA